MLSLGFGLTSSTILGRRGFSPLSLFAASEPGAWYDPSDLSTLYQDNAGTVPVTAAGQVVGLVLDKSRGLVLGPELVANGDFSGGGTGWTIGVTGSSTVTYADGLAKLFRSGGACNINRIILTLSGSYEFVVRARVVSGTATMRVGIGTQQTSLGLTTSFANYTFKVVNSSSTQPFFNNLTDGATVEIDNISVRELPGNHATQATLANRPIYGIEPFGGRRNLLTWTEQFDNAFWNAFSARTVVENIAVAPDGTKTADEVAANTKATSNGAFENSIPVPLNASISFYAKQGSVSWVACGSAGGAFNAWFNLASGTVYNSANCTASIQSVGNGWFRCILGNVTIASTRLLISPKPIGGSGDPWNNITNSIGDSVLLWGAQLETGSTATDYQRVTDQWNVTRAGVPSVGYLQFDGTDDFLVTPTITPGTDKVQVFAGVRKLSDAARGMLVELGANVPSNAINLSAPGGVGATYSVGGGGSLFVGPGPTGAMYPAPITNILTFTDDIAADNGSLRVNDGAAQQLLAGDQGSGNFAANPLYIGRRAGTSLPFNGRLYSLITRFGPNLTEAQIAQAEAWLNSKTGAY